MTGIMGVTVAVYVVLGFVALVCVALGFLVGWRARANDSGFDQDGL